MWQQFAVNRIHDRSTHRSIVHPQASRPQHQRHKLLNIVDMTRGLGKGSSKTSSAVYDTMSDLSSRRSEIISWQGRITFIISLVDQEITALEQVKQSVEGYLLDIQMYSHLTKKCSFLSDSLNPTVMRQDNIFAELQKEQKMADDIREELEKLIYILEDKQSSLSKLRAQLHADVLDKRDAVDLTTKCINQPAANVFFQSQPMGLPKRHHVSYDQWLSHCKNLKLLAEKQIKDASTLRVKLPCALSKIRKAQKDQHRRIADSLKKCCYQLTRTQQRLTAAKKQVMQEISHLTRDLQRMGHETRKSMSKLQEVDHCLEILNQRPRLELCQDHPYRSLIKDKYSWTRRIYEVQEPLKKSENNLQCAESRLSKLEDKTFEKAQALQLVQSCLYQYESFTLSHPSTLHFNRPKVPMHKL